MKITFLGSGTSHGVPVIGCDCPVCTSADERDKRLRSSIWIQQDDKNIVIDTGPDFRAQMLRHKLKSVEAVLITHGHKDHIGGLDDLRAYNYLMQKPVDVYARKDVQHDIRRDFHYAFADVKYPGVPEFQLHSIAAGEEFHCCGRSILPIGVLHHKLPVLGFRIGKMAYITDAKYIPEESMKSLENLDILIINALRKEPHISHFSLPEALDVIQKVKPERAFLTHISHRLGCHEDVEKELPEGVHLAYDGLEIETGQEQQNNF